MALAKFRKVYGKEATGRFVVSEATTGCCATTFEDYNQSPNYHQPAFTYTDSTFITEEQLRAAYELLQKHGVFVPELEADQEYFDIET